jgi:Domain of unknown function (DUF4326)
VTAPARVQLSRAKGFRLQEHAPGAIVVRRPTRWGNPFVVRECIEDEPTLTVPEARERCTWLYELWLEGELELTHPDRIEQRAWILAHLPDLAGHPLACTCPLPAEGETDWCHGAVLLKRARSARYDFGEQSEGACTEPPMPIPALAEDVVPVGDWVGAP